MVNSKGHGEVIQELPEEEQTHTNRRKNRFADPDNRPIETEFTKRLREEAQLKDQEQSGKKTDTLKKWEEEVEAEKVLQSSTKRPEKVSPVVDKSKKKKK
jgi:hypothetical protein